jgi:hypothetical protein
VWRTVWMDGREMPKDSDSLWMGYSIGHWDGDDLVVETANFNDKTWIDAAGHPHSDAFKLTERFHRVDHDHMKVSFTIDDPKILHRLLGMANRLRFEELGNPGGLLHP